MLAIVELCQTLYTDKIAYGMVHWAKKHISNDWKCVGNVVDHISNDWKCGQIEFLLHGFIYQFLHSLIIGIINLRLEMC